MSKAEELLGHAARCHRLAKTCSDQAVAEKLLQLAQDYCQLASRASEDALPSHIPNTELPRHKAPTQPSP
jgi:hypothetical protein